MINFTITFILWICYIMGFLIFFSPFYVYAFFFAPQREGAFQRLNHILHQRFFALVHLLAPRVKWQIAKEVSSLRSSIIVANHLSFLDPILFVSLFERQKTIVKSDYFKVPVFGWILKTSGYMPSLAERLFTEDMMKQIKNMTDYLAEGGNLFIFPEGTRSRNSSIGPFDKGAFRIARLCRAPITVVVIKNTHRLYPPDSLLFNTRQRQVIEVVLSGVLEPDYDSESFSMSGLMAEVRSLMEQGMRG